MVFNIRASLLLALVCLTSTLIAVVRGNFLEILEYSNLTSEYISVATKYKMPWLTSCMQAGPLTQPSHYLVSVMRMHAIASGVEKAMRWSSDGKYIADFVASGNTPISANINSNFNANKGLFDSRVVKTINDALDASSRFLMMKSYVIEQLRNQAYAKPYDTVQKVLLDELVGETRKLDARQEALQKLLKRAETARKQKSDDEAAAEKAKKDAEAAAKADEEKKAKEAKEALEKLKEAAKVDEKLVKEMEKTALLAGAKGKSWKHKFNILARMKKMLKRIKAKKWRLLLRKMSPLALLKSIKKRLGKLFKSGKSKGKDEKKA